jgi:hypothetical protein
MYMPIYQASNATCKNRSCIKELDGVHLKIIFTLERFENILETKKQDKTKTDEQLKFVATEK